MTRFIVLVLMFIPISIIQLTFFAFLPKPISYTPVLLVVSVYLIQRFGMKTVGWWLLFQGMILDVYHLSFVFPESICYGLAAVVAVLSSQSLFSNRSFYGVLGATITTILSLSVLECMLIIFEVSIRSSDILLSTLFVYFFWRLLLSICLLLVVYPLGRDIFNQTSFLHTRSKFLP